MEITAEQATALTIAEMTTDHYLPAKRKRGRRPNTLYGYESSLNLHALPRFGGLTLDELTRDAVQDWVDELAGTGAGPGGAEKAYKCLRQVIRWAIDHWGLYLADPTRGIELPRKPVYKPETLTERRLKRLRRGMVGCAYEATAIIQCSLGLRPSENYCLRWERIDWRTGHVPIERSLGEIPELVYEDGTKTPKSERGCYLPPWALDRLHALWVGLGRPRGRIIGDAKPSQVARKLKAWAEQHKLPWVGMKNLRHTWGTIAAKTNPIEAVSAMMGHSSIQTTYRYYYSLTQAVMRRVQRKVARSILGKTCDDMYKGIVMPIAQPPAEALPMAA